VGGLLGRYGGDQLVTVLPRLDARDAVEVARRLKRELDREPALTGAGPIHVTLSIGVADILSTHSLSGLLAHADEALYEAKRAGRDCVRSAA
jgi:diguanylate cyclase (GGDEF)-like protein